MGRSESRPSASTAGRGHRDLDHMLVSRIVIFAMYGRLAPALRRVERRSASPPRSSSPGSTGAHRQAALTRRGVARPGQSVGGSGCPDLLLLPDSDPSHDEQREVASRAGLTASVCAAPPPSKSPHIVHVGRWQRVTSITAGRRSGEVSRSTKARTARLVHTVLTPGPDAATAPPDAVAEAVGAEMLSRDDAGRLAPGARSFRRWQTSPDGGRAGRPST